MAIPLLIVIPAALGGFVTWRALRRRRRITVVRSMKFPPSMRCGISKDYPNLRSSDQSRILEGLRQYLEGSKSGAGLLLCAVCRSNAVERSIPQALELLAAEL